VVLDGNLILESRADTYVVLAGARHSLQTVFGAVEQLITHVSTLEQANTDLSAAVENKTATLKQANADLAAAVERKTAALEQANTDLAAAIESKTAALEQANANLVAIVENKTAALEQANADLAAVVESKNAALEQANTDLAAVLNGETNPRIMELERLVKSLVEGLATAEVRITQAEARASALAKNIADALSVSSANTGAVRECQ